MIKNFSIFLIFLHQINAENANPFDECLIEKGDVLSHGLVCIPKKHMEIIHWDPSAEKTELLITLSNIQVIEIGTDEITISMNTRIEWRDYRLTFGVRKAFLSAEDQKRIWSPRIIIGTNVMSKTMEAEEIEVSVWCNGNHTSLEGSVGKKRNFDTTYLGSFLTLRQIKNQDSSEIFVKEHRPCIWPIFGRSFCVCPTGPQKRLDF